MPGHAFEKLRFMYMGKGYGFQSEAGVAMASDMFGMPDNIHSGFLVREALSGFVVASPENAALSGQIPVKSKSARYVISMELLLEFLASFRSDYAVLPFDTDLTALNTMVYYDVPDFTLYRDHMKGKAARCQVKLKNIQGSQLPMFEVKFRSNKGITGKYLLPFDKDVTQLFAGEVADKFYGLAGFTVSELRPSLGSCSDKFVLFDSESHERIEVDAGLQFALAGSEEDGLLIPLAIVRISGSPENASPTARFFHERRIKSMTFSRYLLGGSMLLPGLKSNRYKHKIRQIQKIVQYEPAY